MAGIGDKIKQEENKKLLANPRVRAMLNTIAFAEGADYNTRVGGSTFNDLSKKPGKSTYIKSIGTNSTAEGRYQFLNSTWERVAKDLNLSDFSPQSQDLAAIELIKRRGALGDVLDGNLAGATEKLAKEWASLPTKSGKGAYSGQRAKSLESLRKVFEGDSGESTYSGGQEEYSGKIYSPYTPPSMMPTGDNVEVAYKDTPEEIAAKEKIDKVEKEQEILSNYFSQETQTAPQQYQELQQYQEPQIGAPEILDQYAQVSQFVENPIAQQGGALPVSSQGVYDYPMQEVLVPTNNGRITMHKVNYPILGIDEHGNQQMMYPGQEYQFPGKTIHEIPQLKKYFNKR